jgi:hypothetical protein
MDESLARSIHIFHSSQKEYKILRLWEKGCFSLCQKAKMALLISFRHPSTSNFKDLDFKKTALKEYQGG